MRARARRRRPRARAGSAAASADAAHRPGDAHGADQAHRQRSCLHAAGHGLGRQDRAAVAHARGQEPARAASADRSRQRRPGLCHRRRARRQLGRRRHRCLRQRAAGRRRLRVQGLIGRDRGPARPAQRRHRPPRRIAGRALSGGDHAQGRRPARVGEDGLRPGTLAAGGRGQELPRRYVWRDLRPLGRALRRILRRHLAALCARLHGRAQDHRDAGRQAALHGCRAPLGRSRGGELCRQRLSGGLQRSHAVVDLAGRHQGHTQGRSRRGRLVCRRPAALCGRHVRAHGGRHRQGLARVRVGPRRPRREARKSLGRTIPCCT